MLCKDDCSLHSYLCHLTAILVLVFLSLLLCVKDIKTAATYIIHTPASCQDGSVRLVVGDSATDYYEGLYSDNYDDSYYGKNGLTRGRVEVCVGGIYGTVCNDFWDYEDASVVCRQLRFSPNGNALGIRSICELITNNIFLNVGAVSTGADEYFSEGLSPAILTNVNCFGMESFILSCNYTYDIRGHICGTAGVVCQGISCLISSD